MPISNNSGKVQHQNNNKDLSNFYLNKESTSQSAKSKIPTNVNFNVSYPKMNKKLGGNNNFK